MNRPLKIIHLEDVIAEAEIVARALHKAGIVNETLHTDTEAGFIEALKKFKPDIILSDHSLPSFDSHKALKILKEMHVNVPFILVTATVSEEYAVTIIKEGASDYILKDRIQRLPSAIISALEKSAAEKSLLMEREMQQKLIIETNLQAQERERNEIGKELHDNINQILAAAKLFLQTAINKSTSPPDELLGKSQEYIMMAIEEIRKLSHTLVTPSLGKVTLLEAVQELIDDITLSTSLQIKLKILDTTEHLMDDNISLMFYRIIQEQVNNIIKYAAARNAVIAIEITAISTILIISDDGKGFDTTKKAQGIGLRNIISRAAVYDGATTIISAPGQGCTLKVIIPVDKTNIPLN